MSSLSTTAAIAWTASTSASSLDMTLDHAMHLVALAIGAAGAAVIVWGILQALWTLVRIELQAALRGEAEEREELRNRLGYYLLLGLELLVAADIIETIHTPDLQHLATLGAIVVIRTVISVSLNWELRQHRAATENEG